MNAHDDERDPVDALVEQFLQRIRAGESLDPASFAAQHAEHGDTLRELLPTLLLLEEHKRERERDSTTGLRARQAMPDLQRLGDYRIVREVGRGGMGVVFEAVQESLGRRVALKVLPQASLLGNNRLERFRREAQVAARLHHTHIVPVFGSGEADGYHYYAMQFIDGRGLDAEIERLRERGAPHSSGEIRQRMFAVARLAADVARALQHAHAQGTLHRDVKPANLLLDDSGQVWVTDFGLAKALQEDGLTMSGDVLGTVQYMAPEQFAGEYDERSEVYALGATLYELVALQPAFRGKNRSELIDRVRQGRCERLSKLEPNVPRDLETIVARAMALEPASRYATAAELADDLEAFVEDRPIRARRHSPREVLWRWCRRNRSLAAAGIVSIGAVVLAAVVGWSAYLITDAALERAERSATRARQEIEKREKTLALALAFLGNTFDSLAGPDTLHALIEDAEEDGAAVPALRAPIDAKAKALLQDLLAFYDEFAAQNADSPDLREQTARAYRRVGAIQVAFGEIDAAIAAYEKAIRLLRDSFDRDVTRDLAAMYQELGQALIRRGQPDEAAGRFRESLQLLEGDHADTSRSARWLSARGHFLAATVFDFRFGRGGRLPRGAGTARDPGDRDGRERDPRDREPRDREPRDRDARPGRDARDQSFVRDPRARSEHLAAAEELLDALLRDHPDEPEYRFLKARVLAARRPAEGRPGGPGQAGARPPQGAVQRSEEAQQILRELVAQHPTEDSYRFELCELLLRPRMWDQDARQALDEVLQHARELVRLSPSHPEYQALLGRILSQRAEVLARGRDRATAEADLREALAIEVALATEAAQNEPRFLEQSLMTRLRLVRLLDAKGSADEARAQATDFLDGVESLAGAGRRRLFLGPARRSEERAQELTALFERLGLGERARELRVLLDRPR